MTEKHILTAIESLGELILQQKNKIKYTEFELKTTKNELEKLKAKMKAIEEKCDEYVS